MAAAILVSNTTLKTAARAARFGNCVVVGCQNMSRDRIWLGKECTGGVREKFFLWGLDEGLILGSAIGIDNDVWNEFSIIFCAFSLLPLHGGNDYDLEGSKNNRNS